MGESGMSTYTEERDNERKAQKKILEYYEEKLGFTPDRSTACIDFDFAFTKNDKTYTVEEKFRKQDYGDFLIEIMQDIATANLGWYYKTKADFIFYIIDIRYIYIVKWPKFKQWFGSNYRKSGYKLTKSDEGFGATINIAINWANIPSNLYEKRIIDIQNDNNYSAYDCYIPIPF